MLDEHHGCPGGSSIGPRVIVILFSRPGARWNRIAELDLIQDDDDFAIEFEDELHDQKERRQIVSRPRRPRVLRWSLLPRHGTREDESDKSNNVEPDDDEKKDDEADEDDDEIDDDDDDL